MGEARARFHVGLYVSVIATAEPDLYLAKIPDSPTAARARPGELIGYTYEPRTARVRE